MTGPRQPNPNPGDLRQRAEKRLEGEALSPGELSPAEALRLLHEIRVHQVELEMQNDELRQTQARLEESRSRYADLYDFAPVGYLSLNNTGRIIEANLTAATFLGVERRRLLDKYFWMFLVERDRRAFSRLLDNHQNLPKRRGEFHLQVGQGEVRPVLLNILFLKDAAGQEVRRISLTDITELKQVQKELEESRKNLRQLTRKMLVVQELERQRIARDLHDEMGQSLMALKMRFNAIKRSLRCGDEAWEEFQQAIDSFNLTADQIRNICQSLRPSVLEHLGLNGALRQLIREFQENHGLEVAEELADLSGLFSSQAQITVYRLFQECLNNAVQHGKATRVLVSAQKGRGEVCFICEDNGVGFNLEEVRSRDERDQGLGLVAMKERVHLLQGSFEITSAPGRGTRIAFTLSPDKKLD